MNDTGPDPKTELTPSGASSVPGVAEAAATIDPRAADPTPTPAPDPAPTPGPAPPALPPSTQPAPGAAQAAIQDLVAQVAATTTIEQSAVTLLQGVAAQFTAAAPGNAAVAALAAKLHASAVLLGQAITDCTPFAAPPVTPQQRAMGGVKSSR